MAEIEALKESEFPYSHSRDALERLARSFENRLRRLEGFDSASDPGVVARECSVALRAMFIHLPLLGFILRATNVRNAFEVHGPLLRLARAVLEPEAAEKKGKRPPSKTRLLLSSEWDYSPFTYHSIPDLPGFVLIGLPAHESSNPLLLPIAGHELGHSVWSNEWPVEWSKPRLDSKFQVLVQKRTVDIILDRWEEFKEVFPRPEITKEQIATDLYVRYTYEKSITWALRQSEESFCDFMGVHIFGASYLWAFAYLLAPTPLGPRSPNYPSMRRRVKNLTWAALQANVELNADDYAKLFEDNTSPSMTASDSFQLSVADQVCDSIASDLVKEVNGIIQQAGLPSMSKDEGERIIRRFRQGVPAERCASLVDILNAAWTATEDPNLWSDTPPLRRAKDRILNELVLKNIEVFQIEQKLRRRR